MKTARILFGLIAALALGQTGCGYREPMSTKEVEVSGKVTLPDNLPTKDLRISFFATGQPAVSNAMPLGADGTFKGKLISGKYTYFVSGFSDDDRKAAPILAKLPANYKEGSLDRQMDIGGGGELTLKW